MEKITIEIGVAKIKEAMQEAADEVFKSSYSNPVKKVLEDAINDKKGEIKVIVDEIVAKALTSPDFKAKITDSVINSLVRSAMNK